MGSGYYGGLFYGQYSQGGVAPAVLNAEAHYIIDVPADPRTVTITADSGSRTITVATQDRTIVVND